MFINHSRRCQFIYHRNSSVFSTSSHFKRFSTAITPPIVPSMIEIDRLRELIATCQESGSFSPIIKIVGLTFSSADAINRSFCMINNDAMIDNDNLHINSKDGNDANIKNDTLKMDVVVENDNKLEICSKITTDNGKISSSDNEDGDMYDDSIDININADAVAETFALLLSCGNEGSFLLHTIWSMDNFSIIQH